MCLSVCYRVDRHRTKSITITPTYVYKNKTAEFAEKRNTYSVVVIPHEDAQNGEAQNEEGEEGEEETTHL